MGKKTKGNKSKNNANKNANHPKGKYDHLPFVSICTPTYNRRPFWPMAIKCFENYDYPKERMEWIIVDDGTDPIRDLVEHIPQVKYYREEHQMILGRKRNYMHEKTIGDIIVYQDDDDYYPPDSIRERVTSMIKTNKKCVCCTTIGCFHIQRYISIISTPPLHDPYYQRVSEASLCFYKSFWDEAKFDDRDSSESESLVSGRIQDICEIEFTKVINSLLHDSNTSTRHIPPRQTANGCHFKWNDKLFKFITNLGK